MFTSGIRQREAELFPTDAQIAACLWDGLNYVQSNGPHIQCYLQIPPELPSEKSLRRLQQGPELKSKAYRRLIFCSPAALTNYWPPQRPRALRC
ncbi:hypothetical protein Zmor_025342 [Zophobas morio]|uniref:Uncharacterized protein n=1 Tax=Zophobas morio TaxID=2755281 RepID=A0AA38M3S8_9CUCU|nr:hypothetical protein Zmor_025342 [Zophobas morio]